VVPRLLFWGPRLEDGHRYGQGNVRAGVLRNIVLDENTSEMIMSFDLE
jgi:hypothetical protein